MKTNSKTRRSTPVLNCLELWDKNRYGARIKTFAQLTEGIEEPEKMPDYITYQIAKATGCNWLFVRKALLQVNPYIVNFYNADFEDYLTEDSRNKVLRILAAPSLN